MEKETLWQQINSQINIVELVSEFIDIQKSGKGYKALCPFHDEKTPSFSISVEKNIAKCFSCGGGGTPISFYAQIKGISLDQATTELAQRAGITLQTTHKVDPNLHYYQMMNEASHFYEFNLYNSNSGKEALQYLHQRGITDEVIKALRIGFAPTSRETLKNLLTQKEYLVNDLIDIGLVGQDESGRYYDFFSARITFPIINENGHIIGFSARSIDPKVKAKYINSADNKIYNKSVSLYNLGLARQKMKQTGEVLIHEGVFDVAATVAAKIPNAVATLGTALTKEHVNYLKRFVNKVVVAYDGDQAGVSSSLKAYQLIKQANLQCEFIVLDQGFDPHDYYLKNGREAYVSLTNKRLDYYEFVYGVYSKIDFSNANDLMKFKQAMSKVLADAPLNIKERYQELILEKHKVSLNTNIKVNKPPAVVKVKGSGISKAQRAGDQLLIHFLKTRRFLENISTPLFAVDMQLNIYSSIINYYDTTSDMLVNMTKFSELYPEYQDYLQKYIIKQTEFISPEINMTTLSQIEKIVKEIDLGRIEKEKERLSWLLKESLDDEEKIKLSEEIKKLNIELRLKRSSQ